MPDLILHHYAFSPFSQKIRSMLGYTGLAWHSAITREMPPRPVVAQLAGGYRKIPVAQIGADVFCDSRTIAAEIAALAGIPELALENLDAQARDWASRADLDLFFPCVMAGGSRALNRKVRQTMSWLDIGRFMLDRINMSRKAAVKPAGFREARPLVLGYLAELEAQLQQDFLFGAAPNHADFSTYHGLWFMHDLGESPMIDDFPKTLAWMDRIRAFGDGHRHEISPQQALDAAAMAHPRAIPEDHLSDSRIGQKVTIAPADYGQVPTAGVLVGSAAHSWILAREDARLGTLHVHFPQAGYNLEEL
ncbi:glutathione S-transferase family protein [Kineobactrum sediminis]|uniref:Glutathione S-transferase family protein n=1 Tax=Kineobactrum sediminis TaxID=1905677 RepID=A0A2N5Y6V9_9GAMM|nr:glutathione S-transferase family protein [Kineobactrum sediminis]PLW84117.1 glutathione S-transferase family protein [Kineobactrum sediminis]